MSTEPRYPSSTAENPIFAEARKLAMEQMNAAAASPHAKHHEAVMAAMRAPKTSEERNTPRAYSPL